MKKKVFAALLAAVLTVSLLAGCGAKDSGGTPDSAPETNSEYQYVSAADTVEAAGEKHVLDVREWANYSAGRVANSEWCPIFPLEDETLVDGMKAYAEEHLKDGKEIYLVCNSGKRGAEKATGVLKDAGIDAKLIFTVEGGAKALAEVKDALTTARFEETIDWQYRTGEETLADADAQIVDVRDSETYAAGHLKDSLNCGLKEVEDPAAQTAMYDLANSELSKDKPVYLLCYSGNKCAKTGISVLKDAGFDLNNVFIIENGAKDPAIEAAFVQD